MLISVTQRGYIKRVPAKTYRSQGAGDRGDWHGHREGMPCSKF